MRTVVVGAGIVGASTAFHLTQLGAEVYFIDSDAPGRATFAGAGIVCPWLSQNRDPRYEELSFAAVRYYLELVTKLAAAGETGVAYDLVGGLVVANSIDQLDSVLQRLQKHLEHGIKEVGQVRLLHAGGPKELFPYLDSELVGIYLSGAATRSPVAHTGSSHCDRTRSLRANCGTLFGIASGNAGGRRNARNERRVVGSRSTHLACIAHKSLEICGRSRLSAAS